MPTRWRRTACSLVYELPFDHDFSLMPAEAFVAEVLHQGIGARHWCVARTSRSATGGGGDTEFLAARAEAMGMGADAGAAADRCAVGRSPSTRIRRELQDGYPERATAELGRPWAIRGEVAHGDAAWPDDRVSHGEHRARTASGAGARAFTR